jgi:ATP-dependent DNA helicase DinG
LQQTDVVLRSIEELSPEMQGLQQRAQRLSAELDVFSHPVQTGFVRWLEAGTQIRLVQSPLHIAETMQTRVFAHETENKNRKSWIFTSATLGHDATMAHFLEDCGLRDATVLQVQSPFDYPSQAAMYVPPQMPSPSEPSHSAAVAALVAEASIVLGGRTLVLTTTLRAMREIAAALRQHFAWSSAIEVLVQGESPKRELIERFVHGASPSGHGCVLVGSASFWEGVDVPGDALQMVVVDKLPFSPPGDPVVEARAQHFQSNGKNPFHHFHVPQAAIALKQGAGRLIRRETDRGILVVCDVRLTRMAYGRRILAALPAMQVITTQGGFVQALQALTKLSTMDH